MGGRVARWLGTPPWVYRGGTPLGTPRAVPVGSLPDAAAVLYIGPCTLRPRVARSVLATIGACEVRTV